MRLEDAALETRIPQRFLEALEINAPLDAYPAPVYGRAFLREYARFLEIDPEPLVASFRGMEPPEEVPLKIERDAVPPPSRWPAHVLLGLSVCVVVGLAVLGVLAGRASIEGLPSVGSVPSHPVAAPAPSSSVPATLPPTQPPPVRGIHTVVHLTDRCWLQVVADGKPVFTGTVVSGQSSSFQAHQTLQMTLGNAGGAQLVVNGKGVPTGQLGQVLHLDVTVHEGHLRVQRV